MKTVISRNVLQWARGVLLALAILGLPTVSFAAVFLSVAIAPPVLPVYAQPIAPGQGYIWTPGYWAYGPEGYFWVPGTWVLSPFVGALWTPGYWGWRDAAYVWQSGYWGTRVGFYGGVNYGFGYFGSGYQGGHWNNGAFYYNRSVNNVNITNVQNTYNETVVKNNSVSRVSYNGGTGGTASQPTAEERVLTNESHTPPTATQQQHEQLAASNRALLASVNHGRPAIAATPQPGAFDHPGVVAARAAPLRNMAPRTAAHPQLVSGSAAPRNTAKIAQNPARIATASHPQGHASAPHVRAEGPKEAQHPH